ncbi:PepSY domain-containing protein [Thermopetrobacter sp. TC1]|uniref:PepSY domain-containing protein n=1 Tax=Thermopetrobacter sp. TC1 TaxID=1495045 RepID=UPI0018CF2EC8|nr:hypothetical protein [Thermopetrobacter sp. TC1]
MAAASAHAAAASAHAAAIVIMVITHATIAAGIPSSVMVIIALHVAPVIPVHAIMIVIAMTLITIIIMPATTLHVFHGSLTAAAEVHPRTLPGLGLRLHLRLGKLHYALLFHGLRGGGLNSKTRRNHRGSSERQKPMHPDSLFHRHSPFHCLFSVGSQARGAFTNSWSRDLEPAESLSFRMFEEHDGPCQVSDRMEESGSKAGTIRPQADAIAGSVSLPPPTVKMTKNHPHIFALSRRIALLLVLGAGMVLPFSPVAVTSALADPDGGGHGGGDHGGGDDGGGGGDHDGGDDDGGGGGGGHGGGMGDMEDDDEDDHERAYAERRRGDVRPLSGVLAGIRARYGGKILDVKLRRLGSRRIYVVRILDKRGRVRDIQVRAEKRKRVNFRSRRRTRD